MLKISGADLTGANLTGVELTLATRDEGFWIEEKIDPNTGLRTGKIMISGADDVHQIYEIKPDTNLIDANLAGADLTYANLSGANLTGAKLDYAEWTNGESGEVATALSGPLYEDLNNLKPKVKSNKSEIDSLKAELQEVKAQLSALANFNAIKELQEQIAELQKRPTIEQVRDARAGSVVLTVDPEGNNITLGLTIEQSDNLTEWTKIDGEMTRTIPIPDGKKFYRFALDK